jgi:DNA-binding NtrC family response regulator
VGESAALWFLRDEIRALAGFDRPTLVTGPTGAGKELVASALHRQSARAGGPFLPVNCAALPEALLESVLFGHRRGAFTGADRDEKGLFRAADGGTLFLDEVGEMPLVVQPKLLRVLQDQVVMPVGAHEGHRVNVRVLAATHRDLAAQVREGRLREDLYHRIAAHVLRVPSLRERRLDIPELFFHMLRRHRAEHPALGWLWAGAREWKPVVPIGFLAGLMGAPWTGNVRELQNVVERTVLLNLTPGSFRSPGAPALVAPPSSPHPATFSSSGPRPTTSPSLASGPHLPAAAVPAAPSLSASSPRHPVADLPPSNPPGALASPVPPEPPLGDALRAAGEALGLAPKTIRKLLPPESLQILQASADRDGGELTPRLRAQAADALLALLDAHDFNQSSVAQALAVSRTTLIKIMDDLALPRAGDLTADAIAAARAHASGDLAAAARALRVSAAALRKRIAQLDRGPDGE